MNYYIADGGQQKGPFTPEQLVAQGMRADTLVWAEGMSEWLRADHVPALQAVMTPAQPSPAPAAGAAAQPAAWSQPYPSPGVGTSAPYGAAPGAAGAAPYGASAAYPAAPAYGAPMGYPPAGAPNAYQQVNGKKMAAALCAIILGLLGFGGFGVHKFILGQTSGALIMLLVSLVGGVVTCGISTLVMSMIALVEGIIYLTKTDEQFYHEYIVQQKQWF